MPRKSRRKSPEPSALANVLEQSPVVAMIAEHEAKVPTLDKILASREAEAQIDPECQMPELEQRHGEKQPPERPSLPDTDPDLSTLPSSNGKPHDGEEAVAAFLRQREREQAFSEAPETEQPVPTSFADAVKASRAAFAPIAEGFVNVDSFPAAGLKVNRSLDKKVAAIQFAEDRPLSRVSEYDKMREIQEAGFVYKTARRQWERYDAENPGANLVDAKRIGADLAREREGRGR